MGTYKEIEGDLIELTKEGHFDVITHGCNCFNRMGSGIAKQIRENFHYAWLVDQRTIEGDYNKLGTISYTSRTQQYPYEFIVINSYIQYNYGTDKIQVDYDALRLCMRKINNMFHKTHKNIGLPLIGCGLAGGDWNIVKLILQEELKDMDVTVVHYEKN